MAVSRLSCRFQVGMRRFVPNVGFEGQRIPICYGVLLGNTRSGERGPEAGWSIENVCQVTFVHDIQSPPASVQSRVGYSALGGECEDECMRLSCGC